MSNNFIAASLRDGTVVSHKLTALRVFVILLNKFPKVDLDVSDNLLDFINSYLLLAAKF